MDTKTKAALLVVAIGAFASEKGFTSIAPVVRENVNRYPYLTFINAKNEAENIYFSKKAAATVKAGMPVTKEMLGGLSIGHTTNEAGEARIKLVSNSERVDLADLLS